ncbi:NADH:flavorubredoxin reductase NorW [Vibrio tapetis subsp. quintayensis]|uniref:NADH:flavorubredoxin reductase NorW n=1 Tax=Vibrio tapetis TaxID=52443 RepID=UPI0025B28DCD|nr:NADH:flavorubredoxin reductase NorW [Vibrio tapetis]MDN3680932.1 NADH:flavorubredoxin reductase NorW [Vibrio tapetis subsp. quintayensis]
MSDCNFKANSTQDPIVIIGSGFAAYQLVKAIRRQDKNINISVITANDGHDYNKPDLSHVFSKKQAIQDLIVASGEEFAKQHDIQLFSHKKVSAINTDERYISFDGGQMNYAKLVLATGANTFVPPIQGNNAHSIVTLNSLEEFATHAESITNADHVVVLGGGLIGVEIALDLANAGKRVSLVEPASTLMENQLPELIALKLSLHMQNKDISIYTESRIERINAHETKSTVLLSNGKELHVDQVIACAGLRANTFLAREAGLKINKGIIVDGTMQTSTRHVFAIGDCAEFKGEVRAYLQPALISANTLAKTLLGDKADVVLPKMMVKVKTPSYPIQFGGITSGQEVERWQLEVTSDGIVAKAINSENKSIGFVTTQRMVPQSFSLLREIV